MFFLQRLVEKGIRSAHPPQKISKPRLFCNFFINQTSLVNIYVANTANLQRRAGQDVFGGVQPVAKKNHLKSTFPSTCSPPHHNYTKQEQFIRVQAC